MANCCDPIGPRIYSLFIDGKQVSLSSVEETFMDLKDAAFENEAKLAVEIFSRIKRKNYIPTSVESKYKEALYKEYKNFIQKLNLPFINENSNGSKKIRIGILGFTGCSYCSDLSKNVTEAIREMGIASETVEMKYIYNTDNQSLRPPGLVINGKVKSAGKILNKNEIKQYIKEEL